MAEQHRRVWRALDLVAAQQGLSASSLAKLAGLDATAFNPSKRVARDGRLRWPGVETLSKVAEATGVSLSHIARLIEGGGPEPSYLPLAALRGGETLEDGAAEQALFGVDDGQAFFLDLVDTAPPPYRPGDRIVVSPSAALSLGARVVVAYAGGKALLGEIVERDDANLLVAPLDGEAPQRIEIENCEWVGRILWVSQ